MHRPLRFVVLAVAGTVLVAGCALRDPRDSYAYGRVADGLWDADYDVLLDWNFPTTANQGPLLAPQRFKPERPAIGVPWATGNPLQPRDATQAPSAAGTGPGADAAPPDDSTLADDSSALPTTVTPRVASVADAPRGTGARAGSDFRR